MTTTTNAGANGVSWTVFGSECLQAVNDLRWMIIFAVLLIVTDFWWISNVTMPDAAIYRQINGNSVCYPLSDHNPIWCDLTFV